MLSFGEILTGAGSMVSKCLNFVKAFDVSSFISNQTAVKIIVPSLIGGVIVGSAAMSFENSIVEAILGGDYNLSGKGLSDEENVYYDELYRKLSEKSIDLSKPEQYDFILPHKIIAGVDRVLYGLEGSDADREMIVGSVPGQGLRPEFKYVEKEETYQEIIKVTSVDGLTSETVTPEQKTKVQLLEEAITYNRRVSFEYREATYEFEDTARRSTDPVTGDTVEVWIRKKNHVLQNIKGGGEGEKDYTKLEAFIELHDPDYSMVEEHIKQIKELDELLDDLRLREDESWSFGGTMIGAEGIQINTSEVGNLPINIPMLLSESLDPNVILQPGSKEPQILIYHTHTDEAYSNGGLFATVTSNQNESVVRVGENLAQDLRNYGINVIHDRTVHCPPRTGAYGKSLTTVQRIMRENPSLKLLIDVHRDILRPTAQIEGATVARAMFCACGDPTDNPHWQENLKLMVKMQSFLCTMHPGLMRGIYMKNFAMNQNLHKGAILIEFGGDRNSLEEALRSTKYLAKAIVSVARPSMGGIY